MNNVPRNTKYAIRIPPFVPSLPPMLSHLLFLACPRCMLTCFSAGDRGPALYICREPSTNQLLFMQNKPNVKVAQINVNSYMKSKYENLDTWLSGKNKPNSNPIKPNLRKAKMTVNLYFIEDYRKKDDFLVRINKPNFRNGQNERKLTDNKGLKKKRLFSSPKNKPKTKHVLSAVEWANFFKGQSRLPENPATLLSTGIAG